MPKTHTINNHQVVLRLPRTVNLACLAPWWTADVTVAVESDFVWARFSGSNTRMYEQSLTIPADRFRLVGRWLIREGQQVAEAELPDLNWQPLASVMQFQLPWIGTTGRVANLQSTHWQLARGGEEQSIAGAIIQVDLLQQWAEWAPRLRLEQLRYCVAQQRGDIRLALVLGTPVPPLDAQYLVARQRILIPAGMHWLPAMDAEDVQRSFAVQPGQWLLWRASDDWCLLDDSLLVPMTRGSVRLLASLGE